MKLFDSNSKVKNKFSILAKLAIMVIAISFTVACSNSYEKNGSTKDKGKDISDPVGLSLVLDKAIDNGSTGSSISCIVTTDKREEVFNSSESQDNHAEYIYSNYNNLVLYGNKKLKNAILEGTSLSVKCTNKYYGDLTHKVYVATIGQNAIAKALNNEHFMKQNGNKLLNIEAEFDERFPISLQNKLTSDVTLKSCTLAGYKVELPENGVMSESIAKLNDLTSGVYSHANLDTTVSPSEFSSIVLICQDGNDKPYKAWYRSNDYETSSSSGIGSTSNNNDKVVHEFIIDDNYSEWGSTLSQVNLHITANNNVSQCMINDRNITLSLTKNSTTSLYEGNVYIPVDKYGEQISGNCTYTSQSYSSYSSSSGYYNSYHIDATANANVNLNLFNHNDSTSLRTVGADIVVYNNGGVSMTSCSLHGTKLELNGNLATTKEIGNTLTITKELSNQDFVSCTGSDGKSYTAWYHYGKGNWNRYNQNTAYNLFYINPDSAQSGQHMSADMTISITSSVDISKITSCNINVADSSSSSKLSTTATLTSTKSSTSPESWSATITVPHTSGSNNVLNYGDIVNVTCGGREIYSRAQSQDEIHWD